MTVAVQVPERRAPRRRVVWAVLLGVLPLIIAGHAMAAGGALPVATYEGALPAPSASPAAEPLPEPSPDVIPQIAAPGTLEGADYTASIQQITIKFPPPPEPPASTGGSRGGGGKSGSSGGGGTPINYKTWCANNGPAYSASSASSMLTAINKERARNGAPALKASSTLAANATAWSEEMAASGVFAHSSSPGAAENLFWASSGSNHWGLAHSELMKSNGHCNNIMNPALKTFGVGIASSSNGWYLTQRFGK